eukprot:3965816-Pleurochrysis_carterae.AAC.1
MCALGLAERTTLPEPFGFECLWPSGGWTRCNPPPQCEASRRLRPSALSPSAPPVPPDPRLSRERLC